MHQSENDLLNDEPQNPAAIDRLERVLEKCRELASQEPNGCAVVNRLAEDLEIVLSKAKRLV
ncbi:hypothetical protein EP073_05915 [Geovibrio thiophilus]|uniref:Uncharacterized protein n=1 Tax=Geovibrio thiophilus TaxID=139438 RepID=A0A410JXW8_9BACT|nr:hypothetical protein [Geovibrio thiophilus]QAR32959.1 hypothetical protein EP073_05915 [Geovibrio thiophilus]